MVRKGSWQDVRLLYDVFRGELAKEKYASVSNVVLDQVGKGASASLRLSLSQIDSYQFALLDLREIRAMFSLLWSILSMNVHKENDNIPFLTQYLLRTCHGRRDELCSYVSVQGSWKPVWRTDKSVAASTRSSHG